MGQGQAATLPSSFPNGRLLGDAASSNLHPRSHTLARMTRSVNAVGNGTQAKCMGGDGGGGDGGARAHPAGSRGDGVASRGDAVGEAQVGVGVGK